MRLTVKRVIWLAVPHVLLVCAVFVYIIAGAGIFVLLDNKLAERNFYDVILFVFITLSTIGWGNMSPATESAQLFCIVYSMFGIPLLFFTLANMGKFVAETYWLTMMCLKKSTRDKRRPADGEAPMPFCVVFFLMFIAISVAAILFYTWDKPHFLDAIYFSFISLTTIGYGDFATDASSLGRLVVVIGMLVCGMMAVSMFVATLQEYLNKIHYLGRNFRGAPDVNIWFGGQSLTVAQLLTAVADKFEVSPSELRSLLQDLDAVIKSARVGTTTDDERIENAKPLAAKRYRKLESVLEVNQPMTSLGRETVIYTRNAPANTNHKALDALRVVYGASKNKPK